MKSLGSFFERFNSIAIKEIQKRVFISELLKKEIGIEIPIENINIVGFSIKIKGSAIEKNQIYIKKQELITEILLNIKNIKDIQ